MSADVIVSHVTFSAQELTLRLNQEWRFVTIGRDNVRIHGELIAKFAKRGARVMLSPLGPRELVRWVAWAIQSICPGAEATDEEGDPLRIMDAPMTSDDAEKAALGIEAARQAAIAKEAVPEGGAQETVALVTYLVKKGHLELDGPMPPVVRALFPLLQNIQDGIGTKIEDELLELDEVGELYASAEELEKLIKNNDHIFDR